MGFENRESKNCILVNRLFLDALKASLENRKVSGELWQGDLNEEDLFQLFGLAQIHNILPMIYQAVYEVPAVKQMDPRYLMNLKMDVIQSVALQTMKTNEFQVLYEYLRENGVSPCVVKGIICRNLYPNPDDRMSSDEDVFILEEEFEKTHKLLTDYGMSLMDAEEEIHRLHEVSYNKEGSPIYIELHKTLFAAESEAYGDLNRYFEGVHDRLIEDEIQGTKFLTMNPTDHLFYLICHAFKHFLHSGFGIRQVCDITLYANTYGADIDWKGILERCREIRADLFSAAMFQIGENYLTFDKDKACYPAIWQEIEVDENDMLNDLLASGVFGQADMSRRHSSNMTLDAVIADKRGRKAKVSVWSSLFPPISYMEKGFPYLKKYPFLLPVAWAQRVWTYRKETARNQGGNNAGETIKIGTKRIELMKKYGIIK